MIKERFDSAEASNEVFKLKKIEEEGMNLLSYLQNNNMYIDDKFLNSFSI